MADEPSPRFLTAAQVRQRFGGISDPTLWRWIHAKDMGFPQPMVINRRRLFDEQAIVDFAAAQRAKAAA